MICYFFSLLVNIWVKFIMPKFNTPMNKYRTFIYRLQR